MDPAQIAAIERFVNAQRKLLRSDVEVQLHEYGIQSNGELLPDSSLVHLPDDERRIADQLRDRLSHLKARMKPKDAAEALTREQAFTTLNRVVALRMAEARGIVPACVSAGLESEGFAVYRQCTGTAKISLFDWYREYLFSLFDEMAVELPALFDRFRGEGLVFPREGTLRSLMEALRAPEIEEAWAEDETIGWIYQYFNDPAERKKLREKPAPTDSYELAVRNQFFTPRFVVCFLVDNSLGRLWREMTGDRDALNGQCGMLALAPDDALGRAEAKDPRELAVIDPACGSMHFGLYTFEVLAAIYRDAWKRANYEPGTALRRDYPDLGALEKEIPRLVCERNIYGVDIDSRAVQIAGITMWLRAHRAWSEAGIPVGDRPRIRRFNLATAQPMPGEKEFREEFLANLSPPALQKLAASVWDELKLAGEAGSLLRADTTVSRQVEALRKAWERMPDWDRKQDWLFEGQKDEYASRRYGVDLSIVRQEDDWSRMEDQVFEALEAFSQSRRTQAGAYRRSLFADDTQTGFAFLDILRRKFDVVLMNPPFGACAAGAKKYIEDHYPRTKNDLAAAFLEMGLNHLTDHGYLGAITTRTIFFLSSFTKLREEILLEEAHPVVFADLGFGVLDAMVETAAYVVERS
jgi:hypothetical protein